MVGFDDLVFSTNVFLSSGQIIAVFIGKPNPTNPNQFHCGLLFKSENRFNALHLAWHCSLEHSQDVNSFLKYFYVNTVFDLISQQSIAAMCRRVIKRHENHNIPYGLNYSGGTFSMDGIFSKELGENGLTCATFVMALFKSCQLETIDINNWPHRKEDKIWHEAIIKALVNSKEKYKISDAHIQNLEKEIGCARFRPVEVTVSTLFKDFPADFSQIIAAGKGLTEYLNSPIH